MTGRKKECMKIIVPSLLLLIYTAYSLYAGLETFTYRSIKNGEIFISDICFYNANEIFLSGEWEFYPNTFLAAEDFNCITEKNVVIAPNPWSYDRNSNIGGRNGYGTYRLVINFENPKDIVKIYMPLNNGAYEMIVNGEAVLSSGIIGTTPQNEVSNLNTNLPFDQQIENPKVFSSLKGLSKSENPAFHWKLMTDYTFKEIAEILNINENTAKSQYYSVLTKMRKKLQGDEQND